MEGLIIFPKPFRKEEVLARVGIQINFFRLQRELREKNKKFEREIIKRRQSEEFYRNIFKKNLAVMLLIDSYDSSIVDANEAAVDFYGWSHQQLTRMKISQISTLGYEDVMEKIKNSVLKQQNFLQCKHRLADQTVRDVEVYTTNVFRLGKDMLFSIVHDVSDRKKAEHALLEANQKMDAFFNQSLDGFFFMMLDEPIDWNDHADKEKLLKYAFSHQRFTKANNAMIDQYGATRKQFMELTFPDLYKDNIEQGKSSLKELFDKGSLHTETEERKMDGTKIIIEGDYTCLYDHNGRITGHFGIQRDITESRLAIESIRNERHLLRTLIDNLPVTIYVKDRQCRKIIANKADVELIGKATEAEVLGKTDLEMFNDEIGYRGYNDDLIVIQSGKPVINREEVFFNKDGEQHWLLTSKLPLFNNRGKVTGLVGIGRDITEQKKASETIQKLSKGIEQNPSAIIITDIHGNIEYINPSFLEVTGYSFDEVIGQNPRMLKSGEMPDEKYKELWDTISSGGVWRGEFHNRKKNGELYWEWATITAIKNDNEEITNYIAIKEDISLRKKMENELILAKQKAEESDRLKSAFLANMSHEIRTPLNSIIGFSRLLTDPGFDKRQKHEFIQHIIGSGDILLNIINDIMDISKIESGEITVKNVPVYVKPFIEEIRGRFEIRMKEEELDFIFMLPEKETNVFVFADPDRLSQVFNNLISNALKFTEKGNIRVGYETFGDYILFHVSDTGVGIPKEYHSAIFERFRQVEASYKRKQGGNGLGLAISKKLVEIMGGTIWVESEPGKGSTFYFTIPKN